MDHRDGGRQINLPPARAGASEKPAGAGGKPAGASENPAGAGEKRAGASEKPAGAGEKPAGASEKPARAGEKPAGPQEDTAGRSDLPEVGVGPIVVPAKVGRLDLAIEISVEHSRRPRNVQFARKWSRPTLIKVRCWVVAGQWRAVTVVRGRTSKCL